jgi:hypothetical protein
MKGKKNLKKYNMIKYKIGDIDCKISFKDFLSLTTNTTKFYKKDFKDFYSLYEFIEFHLKEIRHILFDNYEYVLYNGKLHNLYGPAITRHEEDKNAFMQGTFYKFYIDGKLVYTQIGKKCNNTEEFKNKKIFHFEELTNKKNGVDDNSGKYYRRKEGIDYKIYPINLNFKIKLDQRRKKLEQLNMK